MFKLGGQICVKTLFSNVLKSPVFDKLKKEKVVLHNTQLVRNNSFFTRCTKEQLWKGVLSVSNAGRKRGRGRGRESLRKKLTAFNKNLFKEANISLPGFNTHVIKGDYVAEIKEIENKAPNIVDAQPKKLNKHNSVHPLDRGWSGGIVAGKKLGPPESLDSSFESVVLKHGYRTLMTRIFGRRRKFTSTVATGNGNGLLGIASVSRFNSAISLGLAQKKAAKRLLSIDLIDKHTVNHDFCMEFRNTKVFVYKKPQGYGLKCHRAITAICKLIGIENLHAKVEGPSEVTNVVRAFIVGLLRQKTYQQIANEKKLHLVEFKEESHNFPLVLASPEECLTAEEARKNPVNFNEYIMGDRLVYKKPRKVPFYEKLPSWQTHLKKTLYLRNHDKVKLDLSVKYGEIRSHLFDIYPECTAPSTRRKSKKVPAE